MTLATLSKRANPKLIYLLFVIFFISVFALIYYWYQINREVISFWFEDRLRSDGVYTLLLGSSSIARLPARRLEDCNNPVAYGFNNGKVADIRRYLSWADLDNVNHLIIYIGENDIAHGASAEIVFAEFKELVLDLQNTSTSDTRIGIVSLKFSPARKKRHQEFRRFNALINDFYGDRPQVAIIPYHQLSALSLYSIDGIHLNDEGTAKLLGMFDAFCRDL